ncbi:RING finger protein 214 isoform X2 [Myripristis murdjan]|uniref:RING finger protein 214-like n=1 Tax=Myripristis murdjan TaxID=586833 RepID=A0A667WWW2_9TELE|nr:RING finger protein 214-like isoform X2 [Myripristis murdjan]
MHLHPPAGEETLRPAEPTEEELLQLAPGGASERSVNTDPGWESQVTAMLKYSCSLAERHGVLLKQQEEEEAEHLRHRQQLERKKEEATQQQHALLDKVESLRVKLELNNSKASRKSFLSKKQEMTAERSRAEEDRDRLAKELEESERRLARLAEEQGEEQRQWQEELDELRQEMERARREAEEAELAALQDEIAAVEKQREAAAARIDTWLKEVRQYLNTLRVEYPQQYQLERLDWEKQESAVRKSQGELQRRFQDVLQQLQQGRDFESLPRISAPTLPPIPMVELRFNQVIQAFARPQFVPPPPFPNVGKRPFAPHQHQHQYPHPPPFQPHHHHQFPPQHYHPPQYHPPPQSQHQFQPQPHHRPHFRAPVRVTPPPSLSPSPLPAQPVSPSPPPAAATATAASSASAGKLDKVLEKLGTRFPQCTRAQLTSLLQQVKSSRGTLAGMSMEEVTEQVGMRLAQSEGAAPGPISRPFAPPSAARAPPGPIQRPMPPPQRAAAGGQAAAGTHGTHSACHDL